jgi:ABC-type transporter Mla subunit MlaD
MSSNAKEVWIGILVVIGIVVVAVTLLLGAHWADVGKTERIKAKVTACSHASDVDACLAAVR